MSQYSEMMGSFIRGGNFPMEADYIFATEEALKEFYNDPVNNAILHKGLLKIVENDGSGNQALYWVTKKQTNDELEFTKLIVGTDINSIYDQLQTLQESLNKEIEDRKEADTAIWGTNDPTSVADDLNSINDLANAVTQIKEDIEELRNTDSTLKTELQATVGTLDTDIVEYLKTLPYQSLTETANALNKFLNTYNEETTKIDTLPQLLYFLDGYTDTDKLSSLLTDLWNKIEGSQLPSDDFQTLRDIEIFVKNLAQWSKDRTNNLQTEIDQTQVGVGLSGDGSFSADKETYYLQDATSVMNALKILDSLMHQAISGITIGVENKDVVDLSVRKELEGYIISAFLKLSNALGNDLIKKEDGLYINIEDKPISDATQEALDQKVDSTTFNEELAKKAPISNPIFTGIPQVETSPDPEDASQRIPSTDWVRGRIQESIGDMDDTLTAHINNLSNPHRVTAEQVGAYDKSDIDDKLDKKADLVDGKIPADQLPASTIQWIEVE